MNRAERLVWHQAVKRPHMTGYMLWMQEAMYLMALSKFAPDVPSISGGHNPRKALEGTKVRSCPPPGPPPEWVIIQVGVRGTYSTNGSWMQYVQFFVNPNSTITHKEGSTIFFAYGWHWWPWPIGSYSWYTNICEYNLMKGWWCDIYPPNPCLEGHRTPEFEISKSDDQKGLFQFAGPNCEVQSGEFSEGHDWMFVPY